jgi:ATP/maltotriose-dependent transcriptional regulator MalT
METAILERLSARVCAALSDGGDVAAAQANLLWLVANGVFTSPIDDAQEWFRCHALLRQFAGQQLREHLTTPMWRCCTAAPAAGSPLKGAPRMRFAMPWPPTMWRTR